MSGDLTLIGSPSVGTYRTSGSISAFTPNANRVLIGVMNLLSTGVTGIGFAGHGTWARINTVTSGGSQLEVWGTVTSASPSSAAVSFTHSSSSSLVEVFAVGALYGGANLAAALKQSATFSAYATATPNDHDISVTLGAFANASDLTVLIATCGSSTTWTDQAPMSIEQTYAVAPHFIHVSSNAGQDTSPGVTSTQDYVNYAAIAFELGLAGGGGGGAADPTIGRRIYVMP